MARLRGWNAAGFNAIHAVERADKTWAFQVLTSESGDNTLVLYTGIRANEKGRTYTVSFEAGPTVYEDPVQATRKEDAFVIALLRFDGSVLKTQRVTPGAWTGKEAFTKHSFSYQGDGSGDLRLRISPVPTGDTRFTGAISHLQVFRSGEQVRDDPRHDAKANRETRIEVSISLLGISRRTTPAIPHRPRAGGRRFGN